MCTCTCSQIVKDNQIINQALAILNDRLFKHDGLIANPKDARQYIQLKMIPLTHETFGVAFLDAGHRVLAFEVLSEGSLTFATVYPRVVLERALSHGAAAVILAHNNPSGLTQPSVSDELTTRSVKATLKILDIEVLDFFIVGQGEVYSMAEHGLL
jgi:DNA repair protein RadC